MVQQVFTLGFVSTLVSAFDVPHILTHNFWLVRDVVGTALYFLKYDGLRHYLGRSRSGVQGQTPHWLPVYPSLIPFVCGSVAGVSSWGITYPLDVYASLGVSCNEPDRRL
jgi:hypothetical protein